MIRKVIQRFVPRVSRVRKFSRQQWKAVNAILLCRTPALGGELHACANGGCRHEEKRWHSCRNRHCPVCQGDAARKWIEAQQEKLLPVGYFHVVFTVPEELNPLFQHNRALLYDLFFKVCAETLRSFFADPRHVGGRGGFLGVLHTWGQLLQFHPHIHWIVPNGGIDEEGRWLRPKRPDGDRFLFPVRAVSKVFRGKFLQKLERLRRQGKLRFPDPQSEVGFRDRLNMAAAKKWNVYAKRPFAGPAQVIRYLGRYTHRIAISPKRILEAGEKTVTFQYKDHRDGAKKKVAAMDGGEFVRRFLEHVLPANFRKIRCYGWMRGGEIGRLREKLLAWFGRQADFALALAKLLAGAAGEESEAPGRPCPRCGSGLMEFVRKLLPREAGAGAEYG